MRTLYLQSSHSINGRSSLKGRTLFDRLSDLSEECILAHIVASKPDEQAPSDPMVSHDIVSHSLFRKLDPTVVYIEDGLFANDEGMWKIPRTFLEEFVEKGGVCVIADVDVNALRANKKYYKEAEGFTHAHASYGTNDSLEPEYGSDQASYWKQHGQIVCKPMDMIVAKWLQPIYAGVNELLVGLPVKLSGWGDLLASGNQGSTGCLIGDLWTDELCCCPYASVASKGNGFVVFIAGNVTSDVWLERCPSNTDWLANICRFLESEASKEKVRSTSHFRSPFLVFLSHRSIDKRFVRDVSVKLKGCGIAVWFDEDKLIPSDSLVSGIDSGLTKMSHFALFWSKSCVGAPWVERELNSAVVRLIEAKIPLIIVRLDETPVPTVIGDIVRIEATGMTTNEVSISIADTLERLSKRNVL